nr:protein kinase family protein [Bacillus sp. Marseille-P3661]
MNTSKNPEFKIEVGTIISGKWHHHSYRVIKALGYGATGYVYLAESDQGLVALKISSDSMAITSEVNVLRHFSKVQGCLGPSLLDVDDWIRPGNSKAIPFYVMEYLKGTNLLKFIENNGDEWLGVLMLQLLADLDRLHNEGWVFGDLKPDNLLVVGPPSRIRWLDVGGTTIQGRSIKEYTEFFDRGYWGLGSRRAEPSYDLFAVAMIMINAGGYPTRFSKRSETSQHLPQLTRAIQSKPILKRFEKVIISALQGRYKTAIEMRVDLIKVIGSQNERPQQDRVNNQTNPANHYRYQQKTARVNTATNGKNRANNYRAVKKNSKWKGFIETALIAVFLILAYVLYLAGQIL